MGCETHRLTREGNYCPACFPSFSTSARDGVKRWNIQPHQQSTLTTKPLLLEGKHIFIKLKGKICSFHKGMLQNKGPNCIIKELYHLYEKDFKGNTVIEEKQKDIGQLLISLCLFYVPLHPFSSSLSLITQLLSASSFRLPLLTSNLFFLLVSEPLWF